MYIEINCCEVLLTKKQKAPEMFVNDYKFIFSKIAVESVQPQNHRAI